MSKKNISKEKRIIRSVLSGKAVNGKDVIIVSEAEDYLKINGYKIIRPAQISLTYTVYLVFLLLGGTILI